MEAQICETCNHWNQDIKVYLWKDQIHMFPHGVHRYCHFITLPCPCHPTEGADGVIVHRATTDTDKEN